MSNDDTLSAMMDDQAEDLALRRLLRDLPQQPEVLQRWHRYQLVREVLGGGSPRRDIDLVAGVRAGIAAGVTGAVDPVPMSEPRGSADTDLAPVGERRAAAGWRRGLGSFAIAASVAAAVLVGGQQLSQLQGEAGAVGALPTGVVNTLGAVPVQASFGNGRAQPNPLQGAAPMLQPADRTAYRELARQRLRRYSLEHAEHAALNTPTGILPFARVPKAAVAE